MPIRVVRLGTPRHAGEGIRLGTVRRPPRGVSKERYAVDDWFDVWLPNLAPSAGLIAWYREGNDRKKFMKRYEAELAKPDAAHLLDALAALSHTTNFSVGCFCEDESRCHRSALREILRKHGAAIEP